MDKLVQDEIGCMHTASAIAQYQNIEATQVTKQYGVQQGLKTFKQEGVNAVLKESKQMHERTVLQPMDPAKLDAEIRGKALPCLMFLKRKGNMVWSREGDVLTEEDKESLHQRKKHHHQQCRHMH